MNMFIMSTLTMTLLSMLCSVVMLDQSQLSPVMRTLIRNQENLAFMGNRRYEMTPRLPISHRDMAGERSQVTVTTLEEISRVPSHPVWPTKVLGLYILLADDSEELYESDADWDPRLFPWQQEASNVLFFTFIHPDTMEVPPSYQKLAASRGSGAPGSVPANTVIMFAIGGYAYSIKPNPWHWLTSRDAAEKMAEKVAKWPELYGCDGIDLDLEEGAGSNKIAGPNMVHFVKKIREIRKNAGLPRMIISQPCYGYPQVQ